MMFVVIESLQLPTGSSDVSLNHSQHNSSRNRISYTTVCMENSAMYVKLLPDTFVRRILRRRIPAIFRSVETQTLMMIISNQIEM
jgi:hypothetical protein